MVQVGSREVIPFPCRQAQVKRLQRSNCFRRCKFAVTRAVHECLSHHRAVMRLDDNPTIGALVFHRHESVASRVQRQTGNGSWPL